MPATRNKTRVPASEVDRYHHGSLRGALLGAARSLLEDEGFEALTLRAAARRAGVSQAAPYHHFADKAALLCAVATEGFRELSAAMRGRMESESDAIARLNAVGFGYVEFAVANPAVFRLMFGGALAKAGAGSELSEASAAAYQILRDAVSALDPEHREDAHVVGLESLASWALVHGLATLFNEGGVDPRKYDCKNVLMLTKSILSRRTRPT